jgi:hypothetical protein
MKHAIQLINDFAAHGARSPVLEVTDNGDSFLNDSAIPEVPRSLSSQER